MDRRKFGGRDGREGKVAIDSKISSSLEEQVLEGPFVKVQLRLSYSVKARWCVVH